MPHTLFENSRVWPQAPLGSSVGVTKAGTLTPAFAGDYEYHAVAFFGSLGNTGTLWAYASTNAGGSNNTVIGSVIFGSSNNPAVVYEVKADTLTALNTSGTTFTHIGAQISVDAGGTLYGGLVILSTWPKSAGTTPAANGWAAVGTSLT